MNLSILKAKSIDDVTIALSVGIIYANIVIKDLVFVWKRDNIEKLWQRLANDDFKAQDAEELKCGQIL